MFSLAAWATEAALKKSTAAMANLLLLNIGVFLCRPAPEQ
jgi:hypothetical protein